MDIPKPEILKQLATEFDLNLIVLFGSRAEDRARPDSDWDLAVQKVDGRLNSNEYLELIRRFSKTLQGEVDLVDLIATTDPVLLMVIAHGKPLFENPAGQFACLQSRAVQVYADTAPLRERYTEYVRNKIRAL